ncbi:hypothetical protein TrLO_g14229 [Triparma laevis f. longispina]|uniref:Carbonic anhydrase n=1 Tax=Triparma laevis f. longispina TaxID=1714387 RepID=A0A9W7BZ06_9STRA|nr:hypothetical protein TrLO_g14229 [Triparma laevis f. longispina]
MRISLLALTSLSLAAAFTPRLSVSRTNTASFATRMPVEKPSYKGIDKSIDEVFENNQAWIDRKEAKDPNYFGALGSVHKPKYLWIGCSDARVPANEIMGLDAGDVFVLRNVANMVTGTDFNVMSALQYAVTALEVPHIIVCGHYDCGGVRASIENRDHTPPLENWLRSIRDVYRLHSSELNAIKDPEQRHRRLVELNVIEQCINLFKTGVVQRKRVETFRSDEFSITQPRIHAVVFDPATGKLNPLKVDFRHYIDELHDIYDLYAVEDETKVDEANREAIKGLSKGEAPHLPSDIDADVEVDKRWPKWKFWKKT